MTQATPLTLNTYSGATRVLFIVGDPIAQVQSPAGMTRSLQALGRNAVVVPAHVAPADLAQWLAAVWHMCNVDGLIATVPHKISMAAHCASLTPRARSIGAVNVLRRTADGWHGDMVDGVGYVAGLNALGCTLQGKRVLLIGAGGAGSAIAHALADAKVGVLAVHDADATRCTALLDKLHRYGCTVAQADNDDPQGFNVVINATPMGMQAGDALPVQVERLTASTFVGDVITAPSISPLLQAARSQGCHTMTGLDMFAAVCERMVDFYLQS